MSKTPFDIGLDLPLKIEIADTDEKRVRGLSNRETLAEDGGLLFVFDRPGKYGIWMKDMHFPIDIAWLDKDKRIIHIERKVTPETYPKAFYPKEEALYVLEVNAGFFEKNNIEVGEVLKTKDF